MPPELDEFAPTRAVKSQVKLKLGVAGPSGSGKTDGALALATRFGAVADPMQEPRVLVVDTENRSASLYADRYNFDTIQLSAPYTPERYKRAMYKAVEGGYDWLIVDSISHEWEAEGGILRRKDKVDLANPGSNSFGNWAKIMPDHEAFIEFLKQIPINTICTMRSKQQYVLESDGKGKQKPKKVGMAPVQREGVEYEFTLVFDLDADHHAIATKNRTTLFGHEPQNLYDPAVAQDLRKWLEAGAVVTDAPVFDPKLKAPPAPAPTQQRLPTRAVRPVLIEPLQKAEFWTAARKAGKTDPEVKQYLFERFKVATSAEIPQSGFNEAMKWAGLKTEPRVMSEDEVKTREAAKLMGVNEPDLQYELACVEGDWARCYEVLSARADHEDAAAAVMAEATPAPAPATTPAPARSRTPPYASRRGTAA